MGSVILINGITSNSITTNTNGDNLLIPIYCPINDQANGTTLMMSGLPTLYIAFLKMSAFNSITSVNRIYSIKYDSTNSIYFTVITNEVVDAGNYYKEDFVVVNNPKLFTNVPNGNEFYNYLFTLRWAPYTSVITDNNNILYFYYGNKSGSSTDANANCTGHTLLINSSVVSIDSTTTNIKKSGFLNATNPAVYDGASKKFYYLGNEFNRAIMMGLGLATNPGATTDVSIGKLASQSLDNETSTYYLTGIIR